MATLGLALIVKNEEAVLGRLLKSVQSFVDQIVVVDTGSTDKTVEIAKQFNAEVHHFTWIEDFAAARNESYKYITTDYILWLDADDIVYPEDAAKIKALMQHPTHDQYLLVYDYAHDEYNNSVMSFFRERISKRSLNLKWELPIHECLPVIGNHKACPDIHIHHFRPHASTANTFKRNIKILRKAHEDQPQNERIQFYYAKELFEEGLLKEAKPELIKYLKMPGGWEMDRVDANRKLAECFIAENNWEEALKYALAAYQLHKKKADTHCLIGQIYLEKKDYQQAISWYEKALYEAEVDQWSFNEMSYFTWIPHLQLCLCYNHLNNFEKALHHNTKALEFRPNDETLINNQKILMEATKETHEKEVNQTKQICFVVPYGVSGGIKRIVQTAEQLVKAGLPTKILFWLWGDYIDNPPQQAPFNCQVETQFATSLNELKNVSHLIACEWWLLPEIHAYNATKTIKIYYCLGDAYKCWPNQQIEIDQAFSLPIHKITSARQLEQMLREKAPKGSLYRIPSAIDLELFKPYKKISKSIGMIYNKSDIKNCDIVLTAFDLIKKKYPQVTFNLFGFDDLPINQKAKYPNYQKNLSPAQAAKVMGETEIWIIPSLVEGYCTVLLEAFAAGCATICSQIGDFELSVNKYSTLTFEPSNLFALTQNIEKLLTDEKLLSDLAATSYQIARTEAPWKKFIDRFKTCLSKIETIESFKEKRVKIGWLCPINREFGPIRIRAHAVDRWFRKVGIESMFIVPLDPKTGPDCDIYIASHNYDMAQLTYLQQRGKLVILDICEDLFTLVPGYKEAVKQVNYVTCCSEELAKKAAEFNPNVFVIGDALEVPPNLTIQTSENTDHLKIGWMGYGNNFKWVEKIYQELKANGHTLRAIHEKVEDLADDDIPWTPQYYEYLQECDVLIAPANFVLQPAKSNNKVVSYLTIGKPIVCSALDAYKKLQIPELKIAQSETDWLPLINEFKDPIQRLKAAFWGRLQLTGYTIDDIGLKWLEFLTAVDLPQAKEINLNVGCGRFKLPGFINLDFNPDVNPDEVGDATNLEKYATDSVNFIFSSHTLEHLTEVQIRKALAEFYRVLKPGSYIELILPDADRVAKAYAQGTCSFKVLEDWILAKGDHKVAFSEERILNYLKETGFTEVGPFKLENYPWVLVPDRNNPKPEPYHCTGRGRKPIRKLDISLREKRTSKVDIIIPTLEENADYLKLCLDSIEKNTKHPYEITVIKSNTTNTNVPGKCHNLIVHPEKLTFAKAINSALKATKNPLVVLLNDDVIVTEGWLENLVQGLTTKRRIVGPLSNCDYGWHHTYDFNTEHLKLVPNMKLTEVKDYVNEIYQFKNTYKGVDQKDWIAFYATLIDRVLFEELGYFDEGFVNGGEDVDFCNRALEKGYQIGYQKESFVFHFGAISRGKDIAELDKINFEKLQVKSAKKKIVFYAGPAWEKWAPQSIVKGGIGGSETMLIQMAKELQKQNNEVYVFNDCQDWSGTYDGVQYKNWVEYVKWAEKNQDIDIFISSRIPWIFKEQIPAKKSYCWVHDIWLSNDPNEYCGQDKVEKYLVLSPWHQEFFCDHHNIPKSQTYITKNGIDLKRFENLPPKEECRLIYSSSPDRGLDVLLKIYPRLKKLLPKLSLHVFYGFDNWNKSIEQSGNQEEKKWRDSILENMKQPGVFNHGRVDQNTLAQEFGKSSLWLYPTSFEETFAITALEAMASGTPIICSDYAGLQTTVGDAGILLHKGKFNRLDNYKQEYQDEAVEQAYKMLTNKEMWLEYQEKGLQKVQNYTFDVIAKDWLRIFNEALKR